MQTRECTGKKIGKQYKYVESDLTLNSEIESEQLLEETYETEILDGVYNESGLRIFVKGSSIYIYKEVNTDGSF